MINSRINNSLSSVLGRMEVFIALSCFFCSFFVFNYVAPATAADSLSISQVRTNGSVTPMTEQAAISFFLSAPAAVSLDIYDPDYTLIRHLVTDKEMPAGAIKFMWDGRDDRENSVPNEAYYFAISAHNSVGQSAFVDSATDVMAGQSMIVDLQKTSRGAGEYALSYSLTQPARVSIRAGIHNGPLLKTIVDWRAMPAGPSVVLWDGKDDTGQIDVLTRNGHVVYLRAMTLPRHAILMHGSTANYAEYHRDYTPEVAASPKQLISESSVRKAVLGSGTESSLLPEYILRDAQETVPVVMVYDAQNRVVPLGENGPVAVSGTLQMSVEVDPLSVQNFQELRYETVLFIDNAKFDEEENVYAPFIYPLDSTLLANGSHDISINLVSLSGQIGSYSFTITVNNE